ncbi:MAG TPA: hypothetical protein VIS07_22790 [Candidatus Binatia bacterium]
MARSGGSHVRWHLALAVVTALGALAVESAMAAGLEGREHDPVVVPLARLDGLHVGDGSLLSLQRVEQGRLVPIPFQLDPRDADGEPIVDAPLDAPLDANDELVFMARDAGERATPELLPASCTAALEIELRDPRRDARAWAYLLAHSEPPEPLPYAPYVVYDWTSRQARSDAYHVDYADGRNYFTGLRVLEVAGGNRVNLLRQSRMRGSPTFSLLLTDLTLDFTEQSTLVEIEGVRAGPVRVVRRVRLSVELGPLFPELPNGVATTYHYRTSYLTASSIRIPWIMLQALRDFRFENVLDFQPETLPMRYFDPWYPDGIEIAPHNRLIVATTEDRPWWVHSSSAGTVLHSLGIPRVWREWGIVRGTVVRSGVRGDEADAKAEDEDQRVADADADASSSEGAFAAGFTLRNMTSLREGGAYDISMASVVLPGPYQPGDEAPAIAMLDEPLAVEVRRLR